MPDINVQDEQGNLHVFPDGSTPEMIAKALGVKSPASTIDAQVKSAAPQTSTQPFYQRDPKTGAFPSTNPIEKAGQRLDTLGKREQRASQSPVPVTNAAGAILGGPVAAARGIAESRIGGYVGKKAAPYVGLDPETGEALGGLAGPVVGETMQAAVDLPGRAIARDVANKYVGKTIADRILPEPPVPQSELDYQRAKTITEAQEAAQGENAKRTAAAAKDTAAQAKAQEAAYNKEAGEHDAIRQRYEKEQAAQAKAEAAEKAYREKIGARQATADAQLEKLVGETKKATTTAATTKAELAGRRAKLQELLVNRANAEAQAGGPASIDPEVWKQLQPIDKARIMARYHNTKARASEQGMVRAARGTNGEQLTNDAMRSQAGLPPPPEP